MKDRERRIKKLMRESRMFEKMAREEYADARTLFEIGSLDFADELQLANQHYGASRAIVYTLKEMGYDEDNRLQDKERNLLIAGIKQKLCGVGVIGAGVLTIPISAGILPCAIISILGVGLIITKKNILGF